MEGNMVTFTACVCINATPGVLQCIAFDVPNLMPNSTCDANGIAAPFVRYNGVPFYFQQSADLAADVCTFVLTSPNIMVMYVYSIGNPRATLRNIPMEKGDEPASEN
jgi:hypothetical protein